MNKSWAPWQFVSVLGVPFLPMGPRYTGIARETTIIILRAMGRFGK